MSLDAIGIVAGSINLSVLALAKKVSDLKVLMTERKPCVRWNDDMFLPEVRLQAKMLKDLVILIDTTNRYAFVSFLDTEGWLFRFISADLPKVMRVEFDHYLRWVAEELGCITYRQDVREVSYDGPFPIGPDDRSWRPRKAETWPEYPTFPEAGRRVSLRARIRVVDRERGGDAA